MTDVVVDRLRIRGTDTRRLASVAARALPGALERALADLEDVDLGRLTVPLTDPADHDDATLAVLWADGIRQAALAAGARVRAGSAGGAGPDERPSGSGNLATSGGPRPEPASAFGTADVDEVAGVLSGWLGTSAAVPAEVAALADPRLAAAVLRRMGTERAESLALALAAAVGRLERTQQGPATWAGERRAGSLDRPSHRQPGVAAAGAGGVPPASGTSPPAFADRIADAVWALRPWLQLHGGAAVDLASATRAAGVVVAYPWLADLCRQAADLHPRAEPSHPRRVALAALADPHDPELVDDPLVRFLAGAPGDATCAAALAPLDAIDEVRAAAEDVLRRFVALLPGFERSSAGFVRNAWVRRVGILEIGRDGASLLAQTAPLDVVLPLLPYPLGALRLPWTPVLTVRFRP
ncbi:MAG: contractile injection system tape measure protein [Acidimicrobiales bacterium]